MTSTTSEATATSGPATTAPPAPPPLQVVATAGHVDHGKSSLILRLTGMDPDRLDEEKRRGLTIDLGFAWCELPSGGEIGFVDVPGHERFIRNMLAGVGPVRLVLFVVAADEGWKPQSEEHLAIVDVLGTAGGVVALTKVDLVDDETVGLAAAEVKEKLKGTALQAAPIVPCSSVTGAGLDRLRAELDALVMGAPAPEREARPRQFIDRIFTIRGAGTVVTGTLTGGPLSNGQEIELYPSGVRARIRGLQTHKRAIQVARPVSRVASNLAGTERADLTRGEVLGLPGQWRATGVFEAWIGPVRGLDHPLTSRGAYKLYAGSAERDARLRFYDATLMEDAGAFARIRLSSPLVLDLQDRFVLREAGRRETVAGGIVLDTEPPRRPGVDPAGRLSTRAHASQEQLAAILVEERGAARHSDVAILTGTTPAAGVGATRLGAWWVSANLQARVAASVRATLAHFHEQHPLLEGADLGAVRADIGEVLERAGAPADPGLVDSILDDLETRGEIARQGSTARLAGHRVTLAGREDEIERLIRAVADAEPKPPTTAELVTAGFPREVVDAATRSGDLVRISPELVMTPGLVQRAEALLRKMDPAGITVSNFRELLGTSRKYALPLLEHFDRAGVTRRQGEVRILRETD